MQCASILHPDRLTLVVVNKELDQNALKMRLERNLMDANYYLPTNPMPKSFSTEPAAADVPQVIPADKPASI